MDDYVRHLDETYLACHRGALPRRLLHTTVDLKHSEDQSTVLVPGDHPGDELREFAWHLGQPLNHIWQLLGTGTSARYSPSPLEDWGPDNG